MYGTGPTASRRQPLTGAGTHVGAGFGTTTAPHLRSILLEPRVAGIDGPNRLIVDERHAQRVLHVHRVPVGQNRVFAAQAAFFEHLEEGVQLRLEIGTLERPFVIRDADPVCPEAARHFAEDAQHVEAAIHEPAATPSCSLSGDRALPHMQRPSTRALS